MAGKKQSGIDELPGGKFRARYTDALGNRKSEVFSSKKEAISFQASKRTQTAEEKDQLKLGREINKTFRDLVDDYQENKLQNAKNKAAATSVINKHLIPFFGGDTSIKDNPSILLELLHYKLDDLVNQYKIKKKAEGLAINTIKNHLILLSAMMNYAYRVKKWLRNPTTLDKPKEEALDANYLKTPSEISRFLDAARQVSGRKYPELPYYIYSFAILTGMRLGECCALKWDNVNFELRQILVIDSHEGSTKSAKARRVPILDILLPLIKEWKLKISSELVFPNEDNTQFTADSSIFSELFNKTLEIAGFPKNEKRKKSDRYIGFHDLRHTFASHWVMNGGDLFRLQKIMGHSDYDQTMRYAHLAPEIFSEDYSRFNNIQVKTAEIIPINQASSAVSCSDS